MEVSRSEAVSQMTLSCSHLLLAERGHWESRNARARLSPGSAVFPPCVTTLELTCTSISPRVNSSARQSMA